MNPVDPIDGRGRIREGAGPGRFERLRFRNVAVPDVDLMPFCSARRTKPAPIRPAPKNAIFMISLLRRHTPVVSGRRPGADDLSHLIRIAPPSNAFASSGRSLLPRFSPYRGNSGHPWSTLETALLTHYVISLGSAGSVLDSRQLHCRLYQTKFSRPALDLFWQVLDLTDHDEVFRPLCAGKPHISQH